MKKDNRKVVKNNLDTKQTPKAKSIKANDTLNKKVNKNPKTKTNKELAQMPQDTILRLINISKKFGDVLALDGISLDLKKGERIGLIGANGAGKTTISEIIVGLNKPTTGSVQYGFKYKDMPQEKIGMQFQDSVYPSGLSVRNIITFARRLHKLDITNEEIFDLLEIFQMKDFYNRSSRSLSGGQRQKLNILLSILHKPELVILDEISTGLDLSAREEIINFTDQILTKNNISAILISHHMEEIERLCSKVVVLDRGKIVEISTITEINKKYGSLSNLMRKIIKEGNAKSNISKKNTAEFKVNNHENKWVMARKARADRKIKKIEEKIKNAKLKEQEILESKETIIFESPKRKNGGKK